MIKLNLSRQEAHEPDRADASSSSERHQDSDAPRDAHEKYALEDSGSLRRRLLIVDDEIILLTVLEDIFRDLYEVQSADSGEAALELLRGGFRPHVIVADQRMTGMSGAEFLAESMHFSPQSVRVVLTGYTDVQDIIDSINLGNVYRFLTKPWQREELLEAVRLCFEHYELSTRNTELAEALQALKELNKEKDEFLGIVAHDLKNPLQVIREYAEMCRSDETIPSKMRATMLGTIVRTANRMFEIIRNLLDINALERGAMHLRPVRFSIISVVEFVVRDYRARAEAKNITLHIDEIMPNAIVYADEAMTLQVVENLLSNAIKYSPFGKNVYIRVRASGRESAQQQAMEIPQGIRIEVQDEGPGISAEDMKKLFGKFVRLSARPTGDEDSTGLGLSIVKKIVEAMNGAVWCESEEGNGARFIVELPHNSEA